MKQSRTKRITMLITCLSLIGAMDVPARQTKSIQIHPQTEAPADFLDMLERDDYDFDFQPERVGKGSFGSVFRVLRDGELRAIKQQELRRTTAQEEWHNEVMASNELNIMLGTNGAPDFLGISDVYRVTRGPRELLYTVQDYAGDLTKTAGNLEDWILQPGKKRFSEAVKLGFQMMRGLAYLHSLPNGEGEIGVIHHDVKPQNVLLVEGPNGLDLKIIDFGLGRATGTSGNMHTETTGTPGYMAPEHHIELTDDEQDDRYRLGWIGEDPAVDVFAAGITLVDFFAPVMMSANVSGMYYKVVKKFSKLFQAYPNGIQIDNFPDLSDLGGYKQTTIGTELLAPVPGQDGCSEFTKNARGWFSAMADDQSEAKPQAEAPLSTVQEEEELQDGAEESDEESEEGEYPEIQAPVEFLEKDHEGFNELRQQYLDIIRLMTLTNTADRPRMNRRTRELPDSGPQRITAEEAAHRLHDLWKRSCSLFDPAALKEAENAMTVDAVIDMARRERQPRIMVRSISRDEQDWKSFEGIDAAVADVAWELRRDQ